MAIIGGRVVSDQRSGGGFGAAAGVGGEVFVWGEVFVGYAAGEVFFDGVFGIHTEAQEVNHLDEDLVTFAVAVFIASGEGGFAIAGRWVEEAGDELVFATDLLTHVVAQVGANHGIIAGDEVLPSGVAGANDAGDDVGVLVAFEIPADGAGVAALGAASGEHAHEAVGSGAVGVGSGDGPEEHFGFILGGKFVGAAVGGEEEFTDGEVAAIDGAVV